ncbi:MAG: hypothetical protein KY475_19080 [Planctomycetes bacterium]|nr:hypothetical protein [Planctomycetota bacterium]
MTSPDDPDQLAWPVPRDAAWPFSRLMGEDGRGLLWITLAAPVFVFLALSAETRTWGTWCLVVYVFAVLTMFVRRAVAVGQEPDVRLTPDRVAWRAPSGEWFEIPREQVEGFTVDEQDESLTFVLRDGFETWPIEIHPPATPDAVRSFLVKRLQCRERRPDQLDPHRENERRFARLMREIEELEEHQREARLRDEASAAARRLGFRAEAHLDALAWRFEGTRASLLALCRRWEEAAATMRIAPEYAQPERRELGDWAMPLTLEADEEAWLSEGVICGPPEWHRNLASAARRELEAVEGEGKITIEIPASRWRLLWVVRDRNSSLGNEGEKKILPQA